MKTKKPRVFKVILRFEFTTKSEFTPAPHAMATSAARLIRHIFPRLKKPSYEVVEIT